ncbi:hypothetical protein GCM10025868_06290 [Angustibacter aerolatus]|uniref:Phenylalanine-tRNA ligase class II N-terminal domain-containing protein n=1 Tax=Angustibacter aerolatus TaxID=1162965 RepID=A0ABQ6JC59_9ACTN|nr:hypothetical protein GCM10025868_06290 [Angustibacter aerolatus]
MSGPNTAYDPVRVEALSEEAVQQAVDAALAAVATAADLDALKVARLEHAGDRSPLALANREIGALPPAAKADAGRRVGQARGAVQRALAERTAVLEAERDARVLVVETVDVTLPVDRVPAGARHPCAAVGPHRRPVRRDGLGDRRGSRGRGRVVQLRRAELRPRPPGAADAGHLLRRAAGGRPRAAHPHLPGAGALAAGARRPDVRRVPGSHVPHRRGSTRRTPRCSRRSRGSRSTRA